MPCPPARAEVPLGGSLRRRNDLAYRWSGRSPELSPLPLTKRFFMALFEAGLTGCLVTQIPAFSKRMDMPVERVRVGRRVVGDWAKAGRVSETAPKGFKIGIHLEAPVSRGCSMTANLAPPHIAWRAAQDIEDGSCANLCIGITETAAKVPPPGRQVIFHTQNGILGFDGDRGLGPDRCRHDGGHAKAGHRVLPPGRQLCHGPGRPSRRDDPWRLRGGRDRRSGQLVHGAERCSGGGRRCGSCAGGKAPGRHHRPCEQGRQAQVAASGHGVRHPHLFQPCSS